jgi:hypothetical protein
LTYHQNALAKAHWESAMLHSNAQPLVRCCLITCASKSVVLTTESRHVSGQYSLLMLPVLSFGELGLILRFTSILSADRDRAEHCTHVCSALSSSQKFVGQLAI